jgi:hypothetical protein
MMMVASIERGMKTMPRAQWMSNWESQLAEYRRGLEGVDVEWIRRRDAEATAAYEAKLVCSCGGALSREQPLFCPKCRGQRVSYRIAYIT